MLESDAGVAVALSMNDYSSARGTSGRSIIAAQQLPSCLNPASEVGNVAHDISVGSRKKQHLASVRLCVCATEAHFPNDGCDNGVNSSGCLTAGRRLDRLPGREETAPVTPRPPRQPHSRAMSWADEQRLPPPHRQQPFISDGVMS